MISAGQSNAPQAGVVPSLGWNRIASTPTGGAYGSPKLNFNFGENSKEVFEKYMKQMEAQQLWNNGIATGEKIIDATGQTLTTALNYTIQRKYYGLQNKIADNMYNLGIRSLELETDRLAAAERMQQAGIDGQRRIARIQSQTAVAIEQIKQRGTTKRAEIFTAANAFSRTNYQYGTPTFQTGVLS